MYVSETRAAGVWSVNALWSLHGRLDILLLAVGRDVKKPPGRSGVQLSLVSAQPPDIGHPHHLETTMDPNLQWYRKGPESKIKTDLVFTSLDNFSISILDTKDLLAVKGDHQDWALLHHLPHCQVQGVNVKHPA